jgi:hypothetical protein
VQVVWYLFHRHHDIGLAFEDYGKAFTNAIGDIFNDYLYVRVAKIIEGVHRCNGQ